MNIILQNTMVRLQLLKQKYKFEIILINCLQTAKQCSYNEQYYRFVPSQTFLKKKIYFCNFESRFVFIYFKISIKCIRLHFKKKCLKTFNFR